MNHKRITRLLKLLQRLQAGQGSNADQLAEACGVSRRTIFRDLETLREAGVPLIFDSQADRYSISSSYFLPPTNFTPEEALSLIALASETANGEGLPFYHAAHQAALKLESTLPAPLREELKDHTRTIQISFNQRNPLKEKDSIYQALVKSIANGKVVSIKYDSLTEWETISTRLRPYQLLFSRRSWYVIGRSSLHREVRTFNVGRIHEIRTTRQNYVIPRQFSLKKYLGYAWHLIPEPGKIYDIAVRFQPLVAQNVAEVAWHKTQRLEFQADGSLLFHVRVSGLSEISWWILGYGDQAEVLSPSKLRKLVATRAQNLAAQYATGESRASPRTSSVH